jgi:hypothetical protein
MPNPPRDHLNRRTTTSRCMPQQLARTACPNALAFAASRRVFCSRLTASPPRTARPYLVRVWCVLPRPGGGFGHALGVRAIGGVTGRTTGARSRNSLIMLHVWRAVLLTTDTLYYSIAIPCGGRR